MKKRADVWIAVGVITVGVMLGVLVLGENGGEMNNNESTMNDERVGIVVQVEGTGEGAKEGDTVKVHYTGKLEDGTVFDSSIPRNEPFTVKLGAGQVIPGWEVGLLGMKVGEKRTLTIAPEMAYGPEGIPGVIPGNATLVFDVELMDIAP
jgi:FKBP-type peptidyl-prolyl cis-trans isomerase